MKSNWNRLDDQKFQSISSPSSTGSAGSPRTVSSKNFPGIFIGNSLSLKRAPNAIRRSSSAFTVWLSLSLSTAAGEQPIDRPFFRRILKFRASNFWDIRFFQKSESSAVLRWMHESFKTTFIFERLILLMASGPAYRLEVVGRSERGNTPTF